MFEKSSEENNWSFDDLTDEEKRNVLGFFDVLFQIDKRLQKENESNRS